MRSIAATVLLIALAARPVAAQLRADPGTVIDGRVAVRVYVVLSDQSTPYAPVRDVQLRFFRTTADTLISARTDDAGAATVLLAPGEYRLLSSSPVRWKGSRYYWDRLVQVRAGLPAIELNVSGAERVELDAAELAAAAAPVDSVADVTVVRKDPSMATLYSFFAPGAGHLYAGERGTGAVLLGASIVGLGVAIDALSCAGDSECDASTGRMTLGAAGAVAFVGAWVYGMLDADDAVRRYNVAHDFTIVGVRPVIAPTGRSGVRVGLSLSLAR